MNDTPKQPKKMVTRMGVLEKSIRVSGRVSPDTNLELNKWAVELGMQKTAFISLCIRAGLKAVIRSVSPEDAISAEKLAAILKAAEVQVYPEIMEDGFPK